jgi:peroxiredoxin
MKNGNISAKILFIIPACLIITALFIPPARSDEYVEYTKVGQTVPSFSVSMLDGREISMSALKGKVVLLNFWATWCPPCHTEMPRLEKEIWEKYRGDGFEMMAIAREQTSREITEYKQKYKYSFPMGPDPKREIYAKFAGGGIPRNYVIGPDGEIVYQSVGYSPDDFTKLGNILEGELKRMKNRRP